MFEIGDLVTKIQGPIHRGDTGTVTAVLGEEDWGAASLKVKFEGDREIYDFYAYKFEISQPKDEYEVDL